MNWIGIAAVYRSSEPKVKSKTTSLERRVLCSSGLGEDGAGQQQAIATKKLNDCQQSAAKLIRFGTWQASLEERGQDAARRGALSAYLFRRALSPENVAVAIGISAGTFLAIAPADILPQIHCIEERNPVTLLYLLLGLAVSWIGRLFAYW